MQTNTTCPECSHTRKKSRDKCLSVNTETGVFNCHHCGYSGKEGGNNNMNNYVMPKIKPKATVSALSDSLVAFFRDRGISEQVLKRNGVGSNGKEIMFPYFRDNEIINVKYRTKDKKFRQEAGAEKILYGLDDMAVSEKIIIVEGEIDKLSLEMAGYMNVVSVPDGAPAPNTKSYESKFSYLDACAAELDCINEIILAVDNDAPGKKLEDELIRRLGPETCWRVKFPDGCKDANDVLMKHSETALVEMIEDALPVPVAGLFTVNDIFDDLLALYEDGMPGGQSTGWFGLDRNYTIREGEVTVVTGIPSHGKSEFVDALMVNLATKYGWRHAAFSPENYPLQNHVAKLTKKYLGKQFSKNYTNHMTIDELIDAVPWLQEHFHFIAPPDNELTIDDIIKKAKVAVMRFGIKGLSIDPWNEIDHSRPSGKTETEYISECLTKIRRFARTYKVHVWLIAHPTKLYKDNNGKYPVPTPYDIAGSAHFRNKADNCITVWRDLLNEERAVDIHVQKIRFREVGKVGCTKLRYDVATGRYREAG